MDLGLQRGGRCAREILVSSCFLAGASDVSDSRTHRFGACKMRAGLERSRGIRAGEKSGICNDRFGANLHSRCGNLLDWNR